ncbi:condensation domain-containing protein [Mycobacteroides abscessus]|uniref:condensation domain-containing protein n=1 Tax=Mycobacteroides abscessus TaxID=36809 RepID=UPI000C263CE1|nr:condensation domain-containing protein [Mycobacteroides abscessus]
MLNRVELELTQLLERTLKVPNIGLEDDLLSCGLNSFTATRLAISVREKFGVEFSLLDIFKSRTGADIAIQIRQAEIAHPDSINYQSQYSSEVGPTGYYPISHQQLDIYFAQVADDETMAYNVPVRVELPIDIDLDRLEWAFRGVIGRHEALRTAFITINGQPKQRVLDEVEFRLTTNSGDTPMRPFDLSRPPLLRAHIVASGLAYILVVEVHHIAVDGVSLTVLFDELNSLYLGSELPPVATQYKDYLRRVGSSVWRAKTREQTGFWAGEFTDGLPQLVLPTDPVDSTIDSRTFACETHLLNPDLTRGLRNYARDRNATLYQVLLATHSAFLAEITGQLDFVVGIPVAGRSAPGLDNIVGMFVNTVPMRFRLSAEKTFDDIVSDTIRRMTSAIAYQDCALGELANILGLRHTIDAQPLIRTIFSMQHQQLHEMTFLGCPVELDTANIEHAMFDLDLQIYECSDTLTFHWGYRAKLFRAETVAAFHEIFTKTAIRALAGNHIAQRSNVATAGQARQPHIELNF